MFSINVEQNVPMNNQMVFEKSLNKIEANIYKIYLKIWEKNFLCIFIYRGDIVNKRMHEENKIIGVICRWRPWRTNDTLVNLTDCLSLWRTLSRSIIFAVRSNMNGIGTRIITINSWYILLMLGVKINLLAFSVILALDVAS